MPQDGMPNPGLLTSQDAPQYMEATRTGGGWNVQTATLFAPLVAVPTTVAALEIWNNVANNVTLVVDTLYAEQILSTAATQTYAIYACVLASKAVPSVTALTVTSASGRASYSAVAGSPAVTGVGTSVTANGWRPWGNVQTWGTAAATPGNSWHTEVNGRLIVPPGCALALHVVGSLATASTFHVGASFYAVSGLTNVA